MDIMPQAKDVKVYKQILEQNKDIQDLLDKIVFDTHMVKSGLMKIVCC
jgi:hypothetical protein